jgi:Rnl2 family RNA ligase
MEYKKYNSIENSYQEDFIKSIIDQNLNGGDFVVQEKVHGANLSFITDGNEIICAKRTELINQEEPFYNYQAVKKKHEKNIIDVFNNIKEKFENVKFITIFGELIGGQYPHIDIEKNKLATFVQRGIYYSPDNEFYAFDIMINNEYYLDIELINKIFEENNFLYAKTLFKGNLDDCLKHPNEFESKIPEWLALPKLDRNICEGIVIKPLEARFLQIGSRVIIKNKNEKWSENKMFVDKNLLSEFSGELSEEGNELKEEIYKMITLNRLNNIISKIGQVTKKDYGKLLGMFSKDILEDFNKNFADKFDALEKGETKFIKKFLNTEAGILVADFLNNES